jgi:hypothetical protein
MVVPHSSPHSRRDSPPPPAYPALNCASGRVGWVESSSSLRDFSGVFFSVEFY